MQTTYPANYDVGIEGQKIEGYPSAIVSGIAEAGAIKVGKVVIYDATATRNDKAIKAPAVTGDITGPAAYGVTLWDPTYPFDGGDYKQYASLPVMRKGRIWLKSETAQVKGTNPFVRFATGTGTVLGSIRNDADTATAVAAPWLRIETPCGVAGYCEVTVQLP
jgi:hypothetical protein